MGNINRCRVDIVANVPEEVAFLILRFLELQDIAQCVLVCRRWKAVISGQGLLWNGVAKERGFLLKATRHARPACKSYRDSFIALQKRRSVITSAAFSSHRFMTLQGPSPHCVVEWSDESLVRTSKPGKGTRVVVESLGLNGLYSQSSFIVQSGAAVVWIYASPDVVYVVTKDGIWRGYDRLEGRLCFQWQGRLAKEEEGLTFGCCRRCALVVAANWVPSTEPGSLSCNLQAVQLHSGGTVPDDVISWTVLWRHHHGHDAGPKFSARKVMVVPATEGDVQCSLHRIVLQCDYCTMVCSFEMRPQKRIDKGLYLNCACSTANGFPGDGGGRSHRQTHTSLACTSRDGSLLATVSNNCLRVWELGRRPRPVSCATLTPPAETKSVHLAGVGGTLALVFYVTPFSTVTAYVLQAVNVHTGQVLRHFERVAEKYTWKHDAACILSDSLRSTRFAHRADDGWLSDITCDVPSPLLWALHSCRDHTHVEAVFLNIATA